MARLAQVVRRGEARGARADYGDVDARLLLGGLVVDVLVLHGVVAQRALDGVDAHAVVGVLDVLGGHDRHAVAVVLAQVRADAAGDGGHRVHAVEDLSRSRPIARAELLHVGADVGVVRAAAGAADGRGDLHAAEDGVEAAVALEGVALRAALAGAVQPAAYLVGVAVEPAAHVLADVAANGADAAHERRGDGVRRLGEGGYGGGHGLALGELGEGGHGADLELAVLNGHALELGNIAEGDDLFRIFGQDVLLEFAEQVAAACHVYGAVFHLAGGLGAGLGANIIKSLHLISPSLKSCRAP